MTWPIQFNFRDSELLLIYVSGTLQPMGFLQGMLQPARLYQTFYLTINVSELICVGIIQLFDHYNLLKTLSFLYQKGYKMIPCCKDLRHGPLQICIVLSGL